MTTWIDLLVDDRAMKAIFGEKVPSLDHVEISRVLLEARGRSIWVTAFLSDYPDNPPLKWLNQKYNTAYVEFYATSILDLSLKGWACPVVAKVELLPKEGGVVFVAKGDEIDLSFETDFIWLSKIGGLQRGIEGHKEAVFWRKTGV